MNSNDFKYDTQPEYNFGHDKSILLEDSNKLCNIIKKFWLLLVLGCVFLCIPYWSVVPPMVMDWYTDDNASHGFIIPLISGYLIWLQRKELAVMPVESSVAGLVLIVAAMGMLVGGWFASELFTMRLSLVLTLCGCALYWLGVKIFKRLLVPLLFLVFMIPIPAILYDAAALPLKLMVSSVSVYILKMMGIMVIREGNIIMFPNITLEVAEACSGLRSLTALLALTTAYSLIVVKSRWHRFLLVTAAIPIAVGANVFRVVMTGFLVRYFGVAAAEGFFHEFAGLATFILAAAAIVGLHKLLRRIA